MNPDDVFREMEAGFRERKFLPGLLVSFIDFMTELGIPGSGVTDYDDLITKFPRQEITNTGKRANTLIVMRPNGKTLSIRGLYEAAVRYYRVEHKRLDYPSAAPHATQAWRDYINWLDALVTFSAWELAALRDRVNAFVLAALPSQEFDPASVNVEPPLFRLILEGFDVTHRRGEPTGAAFQGIVFGFLRADNPHLQIEIRKVRTGSKRQHGIGDVDGWEGERLAISAEVKQSHLGPSDVTELESFANATGRRGALGVIVALGFQEGVRTSLEGIGLITLDQEDMLRIVELWDPLKQRTAVASFLYYAKRIEQKSALSNRIEAYIADSGAKWLADRKGVSTGPVTDDG